MTKSIKVKMFNAMIGHATKTDVNKRSKSFKHPSTDMVLWQQNLPPSGRPTSTPNSPLSLSKTITILRATNSNELTDNHGLGINRSRARASPLSRQQTTDNGLVQRRRQLELDVGRDAGLARRNGRGHYRGHQGRRRRLAGILIIFYT